MPFASSADVSGRVGRDLTAAETSQVELLLELATDLVAEAADKTADWAAALTPVPAALRLITIEAVARVLLNQAGAASTTETLGAYSYTERYDSAATAVPGLALSDAEVLRARRAVYGSNAAGARAATLASHLDIDVYGDRPIIATDVVDQS